MSNFYIITFPIYNVFDGEQLALGSCSITALHTPGHTPESTSYLFNDEKGKEYAIFTGDTLFVGDVGRPDLLDGVIISKEEQVKHLYHTIHEKILKLDDNIIVYPGHGPGSMCGKTIGTDKQTTIGKERQTNYALQPMSEEEFAKVILDGQLPAPAYFVKNAIINRQGYRAVSQVISENLKALDIDQVDYELKQGGIILDTRSGTAYSEAHIPNSLWVGLEGSFAIWVGTMVDINQRLMLLTEAGKEKESMQRLARIGIENVAGYIAGGVSAWKEAGRDTFALHNISAQEYATQVNTCQTIDVRRIGEFENGHIPGALNAPLRDLSNYLLSLDRDSTYYVHCAGGYRCIIASSIMEREGFKGMINVEGGFEKIRQTNISIELSELI